MPSASGIRTLLIDNYDSFTYNLYQLLSEVNGLAPLVVRNDVDWSSIPLDEIDNIVISPGPGRPEEALDFGISKRAILESGLPVLGVCLGHQGIAHSFGGMLDHAPEPMHGRSSQVFHHEADIFAGVPSPFEVIRYHSLLVTELSEELEAIAWTADGLVMGLRHRSLPIWGVQFHPESISSTYGYELLANFRDLTPSRRVSRESGQELAEELRRNPHTYQVKWRKLNFYPDAQKSFEQLISSASHTFWLDSSAVINGLSRFSYMGNGSGPLAEYVTYRVSEGEVKVYRGDQLAHCIEQPFYDYLDEQLKLRAVPKLQELPFEFNLGYIGYLGYELKAEVSGTAVHSAEQPDAALLFVDRMVVIDHLEKTSYLLCLSDMDQDEMSVKWLEQMEESIRRFPHTTSTDNSHVIITASPEHDLPIEFRHTKEEYIKLIHQCLEEIRNGESYEICLTNTATVHTSIDPLSVYLQLRDRSPVPYGALLQFPDTAVLSASPERFLSIASNRTVESKPIKGTRKRGGTLAEDEQLRNDLLSQEKDRAENLMIVDLVRNDLNTVCEVGSVHVPKLFDVETYAPVHQLISTIRGTLSPDKSTVDCIRAAFPGGSMTGAPKIRTMEIIDRLEGGARGVYSGAVGWFGLCGAADLSIVIRTIVATKDKVTFGVGGAITSLSDPEEEFEETQVKARAMIAAIAAENGAVAGAVQ